MAEARAPDALANPPLDSSEPILTVAARQNEIGKRCRQPSKRIYAGRGHMMVSELQPIIMLARKIDTKYLLFSVRKTLIFLTERYDMTTTATKILSHAQTLPEGVTLTAKELLHLGERASIDQALSRLVKRGALLRVGRGLYTLPVKSKFGMRPPAPETILKKLSERTGEVIAPSGAAGANMLGLSLQNPVQSIYLTSGRSRKLTLGGLEIELRKAKPWQLTAPHTRSGHAMRALAWMGKARAQQAIRNLKEVLTAEEQNELLAMRSQTPGWMAKELSRFAA